MTWVIYGSLLFLILDQMTRLVMSRPLGVGRGSNSVKIVGTIPTAGQSRSGVHLAILSQKHACVSVVSNRWLPWRPQPRRWDFGKVLLLDAFFGFGPVFVCTSFWPQDRIAWGSPLRDMWERGRAACTLFWSTHFGTKSRPATWQWSDMENFLIVIASSCCILL